MDEDFRIIGAKAFDGPVTDIRYAGGTYYATVDGVEHAFTRTDWEPGREGGVYYSGTAWYKQENQRKPVEVTSYLIREQPGNNGPFGLGGLHRRLLLAAAGDQADPGHDAPVRDRGRSRGLLQPV